MAASILSSLLAGSALLNAVNAQNFGGSGREEDAFSYIQPLDTKILTEYGSSPAVYPSRKSYHLSHAWSIPTNF
jgi:beta-glucosidase